uniref:Uncharacterized protein n=1 Tax=Arion vulgaris TaxID=1028688 RepID=A0A0B6ZPX3_9EUPU
MADRGGKGYDVYRESCVYADAEIQGHLEKKGVLGNKSRRLCYLQQSMLYMQKKQGDV